MIAVNGKITLFCGTVLYTFVYSYKCFEGTFFLHPLYLETIILFRVLYNYQNGTEAVHW